MHDYSIQHTEIFKYYQIELYNILNIVDSRISEVKLYLLYSTMDNDDPFSSHIVHIFYNDAIEVL